MRVVTVEDVAERLYALPPEDFTRSRNEAAADLRKTGRRTEADEVKAMRKPTAAAAAANRLVREHRSEPIAPLSPRWGRSSNAGARSASGRSGAPRRR